MVQASSSGSLGLLPLRTPSLSAIRGTDASKIAADPTDAAVALANLDPSLFPGISSSVRVHKGFAAEQAKTATTILAAVQKAISTHGATHVTIVGHSLGAAIALLAGIYLPLPLPSVTLTTIGHGQPRVHCSSSSSILYFSDLAPC